MIVALLAFGGLALFAALDRDRVKELLRVLLLCLTGAVLIVPLQQFLVRIIAPVGQFMREQMRFGEPQTAPQSPFNAPANRAPPSPSEGHDAAVGGTDLRAVAIPKPASSEDETALDRAEASHAPEPQATSPGGFHLNRVLVSLVLTALTVAFAAFEVQLNKPTFDAMGLAGTATTENTAAVLPESLSSVSTLALLGVMIFWGIVLLETYELTHFLPPIPAGLKLVLRVFGGLCILLGLATAVILGTWRGCRMAAAPLPADQATSTEVGGVVVGMGGQTATAASTQAADAATSAPTPEPAAFDGLAPILASAVLPGLVLLTGLFSFTGVLWLARYVALLAIGLGLLIPAVLHFWLLPAWDNVVGHLLLAKDAFVDRLGDLGQRVLNVIAPPIQAFVKAIHQRAERTALAWSGIPPAEMNKDSQAAATTETPSAEPESRSCPLPLGGNHDNRPPVAEVISSETVARTRQNGSSEDAEAHQSNSLADWGLDWSH